MKYHHLHILLDSVVFIFISCTVYMKSASCYQLLPPCQDNVEIDTLKDDWFKWGQLYAYCGARYDMMENNLTTVVELRCNNTKCIECMSVCHKWMTDKTLDKCKENCSSVECNTGCEFYAHISNKTNGDFKLNSSNLPVIQTKHIEQVRNKDSVNFSWKPIYSLGDHLLASIYLVTIHTFSTGKYESYIGLMHSTQITVTMDTMCDMHGGYKYKPNTRIAIKVYPVNYNGPSTVKVEKTKDLWLQSNYTRPIEASPVENVQIRSPRFQKESDITWNISWAQPTDTRSEHKRVRFFYKIDSCNISQNFEIMKQGNNEQGNLIMETTALVKIHNNKYDELNTCRIQLDIRVTYGGCFVGEPFSEIIQYSGCKHVVNYTNVCPPPLRPFYTFANVTRITHVQHACLDHKETTSNVSCISCYKAKFNVSVHWLPFNCSSLVHNYTVRWGLFTGKHITAPNTVLVPPTRTSFVITTDAITEDYVLAVQVYALTNISKPHWQRRPHTESKLKLQLPEQECSPTPTPGNGNGKTSLIVIFSVFVLVIIGIAAILMSYRRLQRIRREKLISSFSEDICMDPKKTIILDEWEIYSSNVTLIEHIGEGAFGTVYSASIKTNILKGSKYSKQCGGATLLLRDKNTVAVKFLKEGATDMEYKDFEQEISLMKSIGYHKNIVNMVGCSTMSQPICLIVEYMEEGDLLNYMRKYRIHELCSESSTNVQQGSIVLSTEIMKSFIWQIACGMEYLTTNNIIHRDLAARNILVGTDNIVKISDFGLSRYVNSELIYVSGNKTRKFPLKWMSIEAIYHQEFTSANDVWAYGIVLFEIVTLGGTPYPSIENRELYRMLKSGYRMEKPDNCSVEMYDMMLHCWNEDPSRRPTFTELREHIENTIETEHYFDFQFDESQTYYNTASFRSIPSDNENDVLECEKPKLDEMLLDESIAMNKRCKSQSLTEYDRIRERYYSPGSYQMFQRCVSFDNPNLIHDD